MVQTAKEVFDEIMPQPNQIDKQRDVDPTSEQLLEKPEGNINEEGFRNNVSVGVQYLAAWLAGRGAVPIFGLMEDTATARSPRPGVAVAPQREWQVRRRHRGHRGAVQQDPRRGAR